MWRDPHPKPCYLFALVGGNLASYASDFTTASGRKVDLRIYAEPGKESRCAWAMDALKRSMRWDEERFGREYDLGVFNIVAVSDFNMGAMENKGLNIFNDGLILASPETATDATFAAIERVIAHEYFHNWTGNRITCRDWFQLCLKEGLTVFRDQEFCADQRSATVERIRDVRGLKAAQFPEDAGPLAHPVRPGRYIEINNFYTATVYNKGAELVRMLQTLLGREGFRRGMDLYFERHDGQAATVEDFVACFEDATAKDLQQFMTWYSQAGTPELVCQLKYDARAKTAELTVTQVLPPTPGEHKKKPLHIPVRLGLLGGNGQDLALTLASGQRLDDGLVEVRKRTETFRFRDVPSRPVPSLLRGFSAPVNLTIDLADARPAVPDGQRQRPLQSLAGGAGLCNACPGGRGEGHPRRQAARQALGVRGCARRHARRCKPRARLSRPVHVPAERERSGPGHRPRRGPARHPQGAQGAAQGHRHDPLPGACRYISRLRAQGALFARAGGGRQAGAAQRRARLSRQPRPPEDIARVAAHFANARNATDEVSALAMLSELRSPERTKAFERFYERWKGDHLVIDNWFAYQATSPLPSALAAVVKLTRHPLFSIKNPNKVRALIGTFAMGNPVNFNRPDGKGYEFLADRVLEIDAFNPQVAARLLSAFRSWKALEAGRRRLAKKTLQRVAKAKPLSRDASEIVSRMLE